jgi:hypothetical protein
MPFTNQEAHARSGGKRNFTAFTAFTAGPAGIAERRTALADGFGLSRELPLYVDTRNGYDPASQA